MSIEQKKPRTIEIKLLVPYGIIVAIAIAGAAFITGWHSQANYNDSVQARAAQMVDSLSKTHSR